MVMIPCVFRQDMVIKLGNVTEFAISQRKQYVSR
jgi:hypothetical protein